MREFFEQLARCAAVNGASVALGTPDGAISYAALANQVFARAASVKCLPERVGLLFTSRKEYLLADLSLSFTGRELVPLPNFFSDTQLAHIIGVTGLSVVVTDDASIDRATRLGLSIHTLVAAEPAVVTPSDNSARIIFTSGTTGKPKGVRLTAEQLFASVTGLATATDAGAADRYLSILPQTLLLEQVAGIYLPLTVGASVYLPAAPTASPGRHIRCAAEESEATATVLVPDLLAAWVKELAATGRPAPASLRLVAVGGASVSAQLAAAAWTQGLPVYEGYGLSECCSVVSLNRPTARRSGTVGRPLPGIQVTIENGEIVVGGPTVMSGYLGDAPFSGVWRTGDLGAFDAEGFLHVSGRKDTVIVTAAGRNVSPEWVEEVLTSDPRIRFCVVVPCAHTLGALVVADEPLADSPNELKAALTSAAQALPFYARPRHYLPISEQELFDRHLLTGNRRPRRDAIAKLLSKHAVALEFEQVP
jgi:long-subunit acyl-CoA synthetase (AMP-forming)